MRFGSLEMITAEAQGFLAMRQKYLPAAVP
jgi:hypothetical protein